MAATESIEWRSVLQEVARVRRSMRRRGIAGSLHMVALSVGRLAYLREAHVWYQLDLTAEERRIDLPAGITLTRASRDQAVWLEQLPTVSVREARDRIDEGVDLWVAHEGVRAVFACWVYRVRTPAIAARGGWLDLPAGIVALEDSVTSAPYRGRAIAPAAWSEIARRLRDEGIEAIVAKVEETNLACRRAVEKIGFRAVASMQVQRIGGRARVDLRLHEDLGSSFLASELVR